MRWKEKIRLHAEATSVVSCGEYWRGVRSSIGMPQVYDGDTSAAKKGKNIYNIIWRGENGLKRYVYIYIFIYEENELITSSVAERGKKQSGREFPGRDYTRVLKTPTLIPPSAIQRPLPLLTLGIKTSDVCDHSF